MVSYLYMLLNKPNRPGWKNFHLFRLIFALTQNNMTNLAAVMEAIEPGGSAMAIVPIALLRCHFIQGLY